MYTIRFPCLLCMALVVAIDFHLSKSVRFPWKTIHITVDISSAFWHSWMGKKNRIQPTKSAPIIIFGAWPKWSNSTKEVWLNTCSRSQGQVTYQKPPNDKNLEFKQPLIIINISCKRKSGIPNMRLFWPLCTVCVRVIQHLHYTEIVNSVWEWKTLATLSLEWQNCPSVSVTSSIMIRGEGVELSSCLINGCRRASAAIMRMYGSCASSFEI